MNGPLRVNRPSLAGYYAARRQRTDSWQRLKTLADQWEEEGHSAKLAKELQDELDALARLESYFAYPGVAVLERLADFAAKQNQKAFSKLAHFVVRMLVSHAFRMYLDEDETAPWPETEGDVGAAVHPGLVEDERPYFEVLVVDEITPEEVETLRTRMRAFRSDDDEFVYDVVVVPSFEDALIGVLLNYTVQAVVVRYGFPLDSKHRLTVLDRTLAEFDASKLKEADVGLALGRAITAVRPELDLFLVTDAPVETLAGRSDTFARVFYRQEDYRELHESILKGIWRRYETPFFNALREYSHRPTGVFHALPIARGKSVSHSHWIREMEDFFGPGLFLAESSATTAGLDSLLQPHGSLREAQASAARAFGAEKTYFVTNGTSTANKIVLQALAGPGDIVLAARDCHQSHHYGIALTGAQPVYLNPYPLTPYSFYGGVPLSEIKRALVALREAGKLDRVKILLLTNCTFDGIVYNPERVMEEVLAIHPDIAFVWDEAWFAFAHFTPITRRRSAMDAAASLGSRLASKEYRARYAKWRKSFDEAPESEAKWQDRLLPDPDRARVRVYATHSTHKTLTSLRQGSMIHVRDSEFERRTAESFHQAYLTHTSTSPNYPILASLDLGRRQVHLEGYELVQSAIELALILRERVNGHDGIGRFFHMLTPEELIPAEYRASGFTKYSEARTDWKRLDRAWEEDEFCLDPTRLTLFVGKTGIEGDALKRKLMEEHDIQVNKTTRNTLLFMTHIGTTRGSVAYLVDVLARLANDLATEAAGESAARAELRCRRVEQLTQHMPPLPDFSAFHTRFREDDGPTREGDMRSAFMLANDPQQVRYAPLDGALRAELAAGRPLVSASFVTPYPPGFPVLVPGQLLSEAIVDYLLAVDVAEIHGYDPELGLRLLTDVALEAP